jgi:hypothetical protein
LSFFGGGRAIISAILRLAGLSVRDKSGAKAYPLESGTLGRARQNSGKSRPFLAQQ